MGVMRIDHPDVVDFIRVKEDTTALTNFNLSVSVALVASALAGRRRLAIGAQGDLSTRERALLRARWYALSVRHAEEILAQRVSDLTHDNVAEVPQDEDNE